MSLTKKLKGTERIINSLALKTEREIMKNYARQLRGMRSKLADVFDKYFREGKLDYAEIQVRPFEQAGARNHPGCNETL